MSAIDKFQNDANHISSTLNVSGRFTFQEEAMKLVVGDIVQKLKIKPTDELLDIGCNCGDLTIPLSFFCKNVTGIDGKSTIERMENRIQGISNITTISGNFMTINVEKKYDCILAYSVLMYLESYQEKLQFVLKAAECLKPGGRLLVGDVVNSSRKNRFKSTNIGRKIDLEYNQKMNCLTEEDKKSHAYSKEMDGLWILDDEYLMKLLLEVRNNGYESYLLPQKHELPFGYTRDDILICAWD